MPPLFQQIQKPSLPTLLIAGMKRGEGVLAMREGEGGEAGGAGKYLPQ